MRLRSHSAKLSLKIILFLLKMEANVVMDNNLLITLWLTQRLLPRPLRLSAITHAT
jgi:hypothetical protein